MYSFCLLNYIRQNAGFGSGWDTLCKDTWLAHKRKPGYNKSITKLDCIKPSRQVPLVSQFSCHRVFSARFSLLTK